MGKLLVSETHHSLSYSPLHALISHSLTIVFLQTINRAEIMNHCGVLDYHEVIEDHYDAITKVKDVCFAQADRFRKTVRKAVNPVKIQAFVDQERMASLGVASGALVGIVL